LDVRPVVEGSVRRVGNNLRVTAQLIDSPTDAHVSAEKYSGTLDDVFDVQEQLSRRIVDALRLMLTAAERAGLTARPMSNAAAYECYLRATYEVILWTRDGLARAELHLTHGQQIIGEHPSILAALSFVHSQRVNLGFGQEDNLAKALAYADRALALDPTNPHAHFSKGVLGPLQGDLPKAIRHLRQAVSAEPGNATSIGWLCWLSLLAGKVRAADPLPDRMLRLDPANPNSHLIHALYRFMQGRFERAAQLAGAFLDMAPGVPIFVFWSALILAYAGRDRESQDVLAELPDEPGDDGFAPMGLMLRCILSGDRAGFTRLMPPQFEAYARRDLQFSWHAAAFYARLGERELALNWLANAVEQGFSNTQQIQELDPFLERIRQDPSFQLLVERSKRAETLLDD